MKQTRVVELRGEVVHVFWRQGEALLKGQANGLICVRRELQTDRRLVPPLANLLLHEFPDALVRAFLDFDLGVTRDAEE